MSHRFKRLRITPEMFCRLFHAGKRQYEVTENPVPKDARVVNVAWGWPNTIDLLIESAEFPGITEGVVPDLVPVIVVHDLPDAPANPNPENAAP